MKDAGCLVALAGCFVVFIAAWAVATSVTGAKPLFESWNPAIVAACMVAYVWAVSRMAKEAEEEGERREQAARGGGRARTEP